MQRVRKNTFNHAWSASHCSSITSRTIAAARSGLRVGFTGCRQCALLRAIQWNTSGHYFSDLFAGREIARAGQSQGFRKHGTPFLTHSVSTCSPFPFEIRYQAGKGFSCLSRTAKWSDFNASFASCIVLVLFSAKYKIPTALVQPRESLVWQATTYQALLQSQRHTDVHLDLCQFGHKMRRPTHVLQANVDPCDAEKLCRSSHGFDFALFRKKLTAKHETRSRAKCQWSFVTPWCAHDSRAACQVLLQSSLPF